MCISRTLVLTATVAANSLTLSSFPVQAITISPVKFFDDSSVMLDTTRAKLVGIGNQNLLDFGVARSSKGTPNAPWLCDLTGTTEVEGVGAKTLLTSEVLDFRSKDVFSLFQEIHQYSNEKRATRAYGD